MIEFITLTKILSTRIVRCDIPFVVSYETHITLKGLIHFGIMYLLVQRFEILCLIFHGIMIQLEKASDAYDGTHLGVSTIHPVNRLPKEFIGLPNGHPPLSLRDISSHKGRRNKEGI